MKSSIKRIAMLCALLFAVLCLCACGMETQDVPLASEADIYDMQRLYRNSSLVVVGSCYRVHTNADGNTCCDMKIERTIAGSLAEEGDTIHCANSTMKVGISYLVYLEHGEDVYQSEDMDSFDIVDGAAYAVKNDVVYYNGTVIDIAAIESGIQGESGVISAQAEPLYYKNISALTNGSDYIFIGRITDVPASKLVSFRSNEDGATIENKMFASVLSVDVYGSMKGELKYGSTISVVYCPMMVENMIDAATLKPTYFTLDKLPVPKEGQICLFFLTSGPDEKQEYLFGVNPLQFMVEVGSGDTVQVDSANRALSGYKSLDAVVRNIKKALNG